MPAATGHTAGNRDGAQADHGDDGLRQFRRARSRRPGTLALFLVVAGGTAYAADTVGSSDVINESLLSEDIKNNEVGSLDLTNNQVRSADVANGQLNDEDIAQGTFVNFNANVTTVPAHFCFTSTISGIGAQGDHLLLTPSGDDSQTGLIYSVKYRGASEHAVLQACNPTDEPVADGFTHFNLLVIDAQ